MKKNGEIMEDKFGIRLVDPKKFVKCEVVRLNKTYGFEIQDARLGGLMQRVKSCRERLLAFCDGEIDGIEELSEAVLPNDGGNVPYWREMVTACVV